MDAWSWDAHWTLEVPELDAQHDAVMLAWDAVRALKPKERTQAWRQLTKEMCEHFAFEDNWMDSSDFVHHRYHKREHKAFLAEMDAVLEDAEAGFPIEDDVALAVRGWLNGHVKGLDRDFARFLQEREAWDLRREWELEEFEHRSALLEA